MGFLSLEVANVAKNTFKQFFITATEFIPHWKLKPLNMILKQQIIIVAQILDDNNDFILSLSDLFFHAIFNHDINVLQINLVFSYCSNQDSGLFYSTCCGKR